VYVLGIDLGTTCTAAAVWRGGRAEICALGTRSASAPSVVLVRADGSVLTEEAATRRALAEPVAGRGQATFPSRHAAGPQAPAGSQASAAGPPNPYPPNPYPPNPPAATAPRPPLGTYPTIQPGYCTNPVASGPAFATPMPGTPASRGVALRTAARGSSHSRWLLPTVAATLTLVAPVATLLIAQT
jgi:hypothetical protein